MKKSKIFIYPLLFRKKALYDESVDDLKRQELFEIRSFFKNF